jgi:hypothetical protein
MAKYGIYLPGDTEQWFKVKFSNLERAHWYAESSGLEADEYEIRKTTDDPTDNAEAA